MPRSSRPPVMVGLPSPMMPKVKQPKACGGPTVPLRCLRCCFVLCEQG
jgi:hypothetical protein